MILLMGIAGSGKGTQGQLLAESYGFKVISMGDVIRTHANDEQRQRMLAGELMRDEEATAMIDVAIDEIPADQEVILDGYPRSIPQAEWILSQVSKGRFKLRNVFHLVASREAVKARLLGRGRADDNDASIEARFNEYERATAPLFDWFQSHDITVTDIDAERPVEQVSADFIKNLNQA